MLEVLVLAAAVVLEEAIDELADEFIDFDFLFFLIVALVTFDLVSVTFIGSDSSALDDFDDVLFLFMAIVADLELVVAATVAVGLDFDFFDLKRSVAISAAALNMKSREDGDFDLVFEDLVAAVANDELGRDEDKKPLVDEPPVDDEGATEGRCRPRHIKYFSIVLTAANGSTLTGPPFH